MCLRGETFEAALLFAVMTDAAAAIIIFRCSAVYCCVLLLDDVEQLVEHCTTELQNIIADALCWSARTSAAVPLIIGAESPQLLPLLPLPKKLHIPFAKSAMSSLMEDRLLVVLVVVGDVDASMESGESRLDTVESEITLSPPSEAGRIIKFFSSSPPLTNRGNNSAISIATSVIVAFSFFINEDDASEPSLLLFIRRCLSHT